MLRSPELPAFDPCGHETPVPDLEALAALVRQFDHPRVLEVGSWAGSSALAMIEAGAKEVHCVDTWQGSAEVDGETVRRAFLRNINGHIGRVHVYHGASTIIAKFFPFRLDLVFIDADHAYESVLADIKAWTPHVRHGGIVCGHDVSMPDVERAVRETGEYQRAGWSVWWRTI